MKSYNLNTRCPESTRSLHLRDELLNETLFTSLAQTRVATALWRADYNTARPHSQIAWQTPDEFASTFTPAKAEAPFASPIS